LKSVKATTSINGGKEKKQRRDDGNDSKKHPTQGREAGREKIQLLMTERRE